MITVNQLRKALIEATKELLNQVSRLDSAEDLQPICLKSSLALYECQKVVKSFIAQEEAQ